MRTWSSMPLLHARLEMCTNKWQHVKSQMRSAFGRSSGLSWKNIVDYQLLSFLVLIFIPDSVESVARSHSSETHRSSTISWSMKQRTCRDPWPVNESTKVRSVESPRAMARWWRSLSPSNQRRIVPSSNNEIARIVAIKMMIVNESKIIGTRSNSKCWGFRNADAAYS